MLAEPQDPLDELSRENAKAEELLEHLGNLAARLRAGPGVTSSEVAEGLDLLWEYRRLHAQRFDRDFEPEARSEANPKCYEHLDQITLGHGMEDAAIESVRRLAYLAEDHDSAARQELARQIDGLVEADHERILYETEYPLACLMSVVPEETATAIVQRFAETQEELIGIEDRIQGYLARSSSAPSDRHAVLECAHAGCPARADVALVPAPGGTFTLALPEGWRVDPPPGCDAHLEKPASTIRGCCPTHLAERERLIRASGALRTWADDGGRPAPSSVLLDEARDSECEAPAASQSARRTGAGSDFAYSR